VYRQYSFYVVRVSGVQFDDTKLLRNGCPIRGVSQMKSNESSTFNYSDSRGVELKFAIAG
jgi:hypothetical protein